MELSEAFAAHRVRSLPRQAAAKPRPPGHETRGPSRVRAASRLLVGVVAAETPGKQGPPTLPGESSSGEHRAMARHTTTSDADGDERHGLLQGTIDVFLDRTRAVVDLMATAGSGALGKVPEPVPSTVTRMLSSLRQLAEQAPPLTAEFDVLVEEVHAKRLSIVALQAELGALDRQLEVLERTLTPVQAWAHQWERLQQSLVGSLNLPKS